MTSYECELRPGGTACGWCQPCRSVQRMAYGLWRENGGKDYELIARHASKATGRPLASVRKLLTSFRSKGDPSTWAGQAKGSRRYGKPRHVAEVDDEPDESWADAPGCVRCGLRGEHECLQAPSPIGSSAVALLGAV